VACFEALALELELVQIRRKKERILVALIYSVVLV
jgi:hypothetical protein